MHSSKIPRQTSTSSSVTVRAGQKRIVLPKITDLQIGMPRHLATVEFFFAQHHAQERTLPGPVAADEPDFDVVVDGGIGTCYNQLASGDGRGGVDEEAVAAQLHCDAD